MTDPLLEYRSEFPILSETTYLISNSLGAMPRGALQSLRDYAETWATRGVRAWEERWWTMALEVGNQVGELMNSPANSVSLFGNVTQCQAVVASCFDTQRNKAVYSNLTAGLFFLPAGNLSGCRAAREASRYPPSRGRPEV